MPRGLYAGRSQTMITWQIQGKVSYLLMRKRFDRFQLHWKSCYYLFDRKSPRMRTGRWHFRLRMRPRCLKNCRKVRFQNCFRRFIRKKLCMWTGLWHSRNLCLVLIRFPNQIRSLHRIRPQPLTRTESAALRNPVKNCLRESDHLP